MQLLKQSTAATVLVGPVLDSAGLAITTAVIGDFQITKNGSSAALASPATATHSHNGNYLIALSTGNTDTAGRLDITVNNAAQAMAIHRCTVLLPSVFDAIVTNATNTTGGLAAATGTISAFAGAVSTFAGGAVASVTGAVGSISGVTFPANFGSMAINAGNGHVAVVVHAVQAGAYTSAAFSANWFTADGLASDAATEIAAAVAATQALSRLDSMIESDGAGQFRLDTIAVSMVAGGAGGTDWTANERTAIRAILGVPTSGTTPTDPSSGILDEIRDKTALITAGGTVNVSTPVTATGQLASPLIIGDDYLAANGRRFRWTVALPSGYVIATSTARFGMRYEDGQGVNQFIATGTVTDATGGNVHLDFDVAKTVTGTLRPGWYGWSVEIVSDSGVKITRVKSGKSVEWQEKQT
jgi:hypothetical protein